ncbi:MAG: serine/threonine protein kinase [Myxococcales bacterium 68-20]|nr:serine/threonine protein kinase [Myxococcales bacterium]OJY26297.1 MAG: serine/threonine protein kinase [Myxococcales bacterium 68-20]
MDRIGEYLVRRLIGEGGMGKVYEAEERLSKRRVALKVLRPELTRHEEGRRLFLNEMQILAHLEHPNLVRSLASMETDGQLVMVLEYLHGRTLRQELTRRGALPWQEALEHVVRIAEALTVAHEQEPPIVHRDLKPENVMLTVAEGAAEDAAPAGLKVMDFGIAKVLEGMHGTNTQSIGTLQYMSPEQIDARTIDARSDLYSLGLIFYEMIAGEPPFSSASPRELLNLQCTAPAPALDDEVRSGLPRGVEEMLFAMLEKKPESRPASAREVSERLSLFRAAGASSAAGRSSRARSTPSGEGARVSAAPPTPRMAGAPERSTGERAPSSGSSRDGGTTRDERGEGDEPKKERPRTDTIALVEANASKAREVPTWLAVIAIVALSLVAGMTTYLVRLKTTSDAQPAATATAEGRAGRSIGADEASSTKR